MRKLLSLMLIVLIGALLVVSCNDSPTPTPPSPSDPTYTPTLTSYNAKEVFEKIFRRFDQYDKTKSSVSTWVFTITRNTLIDHYRRTKPQEELDENLSDDSEIDEGLLQNESLEELAAALRSMPEELRDLIVLRYYDNRPLTEVAEMMGMSYGAVKLRHQKALGMLKRALSDG